VVLTPDTVDQRDLSKQILATCAAELAAFKVPALIRFVPDLPITAGGKLLRS
jgi:acyl-coenzyme A synthetase/AMP-(fatty) acid ligase